MPSATPGAARLAAEVFVRHADFPFLIDTIGGRELSYGEVDGLAGRFAAELVRRGAAPGDRVGVVLPNCAELAILYFACLRVGVTAVPLGTETPEPEIERALRTTRCRLAIRSTDGLLAAEPGGALPEADPDALLTIGFTSGTTATPKGVAHRARSLFAAAAAFAEQLEFDPDDRFLHLLPMSYMAGFLNSLLCPFVAGASVVLVPPFDNRTLLRFWKPIVEHDVTRLWLTPTIVAALLQVDRDPAGPQHAATRIRTISSVTAPLPRRAAEEFEARYGARLYESYGLSELTFVTTDAPPLDSLPGSAGRLLPGVEAREAADGELLVRSPYAMAGYVGDDGEPDGATSPEWFPTGDLGRVDEHGFLFVTGRKKDVIIRGGMNVSPRAIEETLERHPAVTAAAVVGVPHDVLGEDVVAAVVLTEGRTLEGERASLLALCREHLPPTSVPGAIAAVESLPRNATGKVRKEAVRELLGRR